MYVLCALSTCPRGNLIKWGRAKNDEEDSMLECCRPLGVEVHELILSETLVQWQPPAASSYQGLHGIKSGDFRNKR